MSLEFIFSKNYLFDAIPPTYSRLTIYLLAFFVVLFLLVVYIKLMPDLVQKVFSRLNVVFLTTGSLGLIYLFSRYEQLPWLGSRFFLGMILLLWLVWTVWSVIWIYLNLSKIVKKQKNDEIFKKYLPKSKNI